MRLRHVPPVTWTVLGASMLTTLGSLPVFLLGAQSVFIRDELGFGERSFGIAVGAFFAAAALAALLGGRVADRVGRRVTSVAAGLLAAGGGWGIAAGAHSWLVLVVLMAVLGVANAACQVTANLALAHVVPPHRRGLGFGVKQSAVPLAIVVAGLAVPTVSVLAGWRWTFALTGLAGLATVAAGLRVPGGSAGEAGGVGKTDRPPMPALVITMAAIALASAAANSLAAFVASWGFQVGLTPGEAGVLIAVGSALNIAGRVVAGHLADRRQGRNLPVVAAQMLVGAGSLAALSVPSPVAVVAAGLLALTVGWSWPGLLLYAVVRIGRDAPGAASGVLQAGAFVGGATGPVAFGVTVEAAGYETAWRLAALLFLLAAALIVVARRMFIADLVARPPREAIPHAGNRRRTAHPRRGTAAASRGFRGDPSRLG